MYSKQRAVIFLFTYLRSSSNKKELRALRYHELKKYDKSALKDLLKVKIEK